MPPGNGEPGAILGADLGVSWKLATGTDAAVQLGVVSQTDVGLETNLDFTARHFSSDNTVFLGAFQAGVYSPEDGDGDYFVGIPVKYGWLFNQDNNRLKGAVLLGADIQVSKAGEGDPNLGVGLPIAEVAAEYRILDWMFVRSGIRGGFGLKLMGNEGYSDLDANTRYEQTEFNAGVGFLWGQFAVDTAVTYSSLNRGPNFIGGGTAPLFAGVSLAYRLDGGSAASTSDAGTTPALETASAPEGL